MKNIREYVPPLPSDFPPNMVKRVCCKNCGFYYTVSSLCGVTGRRAKPMKLHQCPQFKKRSKK